MSYNTYPQNPFPPNSENAGGGGSPYILPVASANTLGGVKVGNNLSIDANGVLSANNQIVDYSTTEQATGRKWLGSPTYQIVIDLGEEKSVASNTWYTVGSHLSANAIINGIGISGGGGTIPLQIVEDTTDGIKILQTRNVQVGVRYVWLEYTKITT